MLRKLRIYFRRRKCHLICLAVCLVLLCVFALSNNLESAELNGDVLDTLKHHVIRRGGIDGRGDMTPMDMVGLKVNNNNNDNNDNNNDNNNINFNGDIRQKRHENLMFVRVNNNNNNNRRRDHNNDEDAKDIDVVIHEEIKENNDIDDDDNDDENNEGHEDNDKQIINIDNEINNDEIFEENNANNNHNQNALLSQNFNNQPDIQEEEQHNLENNLDNIGGEDNNNNNNNNNEVLLSDLAHMQQDGRDMPPPNVLQTHKWFGNLSIEGQRARNEVMAALEEDKKNTYEVDLPNMEFKEAVEYPFFIDFGHDGAPGEGGQPVQNTVQKSKTKAERDAEYKINQFNLWVSNQVALHRSLREMRTPECLAQQYDISPFPSVSVVLVFHDEAWTTLLRSVHSIIDRTPTQALLEIILLDDNSDLEFLGRPLEQYLQPLKVVRLIRSSKRLGLIKARNLGFVYARGEIVVFLDSHIECFPGWLEPLVVPIIKDPRSVTFPVIPNISKDNFGINQPATSTVGGFRIHTMTFKWDTGGPEGQLYYKSPTMPGGLYAISREWFKYMGAYDPELLFWGGENLEISFKTWMCGGNIQASACSLVGHVFRKDSPFHFDGFTKAIQRNLLRVADIWMDEFKHFYLEKFTYIFDPFGDTSLQRTLRANLQCHSFRWYIENVHQRLIKEIDPDGVYSGNIRNVGHNQCLCTEESKSFSIQPILLGCSMMHYREVWQYRTDGVLSMYDRMMRVIQDKPKEDGTARYHLSMETLQVDNMAKYAVFTYDENQHFVHIDTGLCLDIEVVAGKEYPKVVVVQCEDSPSQKWTLQTREELQKFHRERGVTGIVW